MIWPGTPTRSCRSCSNCSERICDAFRTCEPRYGTVGYGTVACIDGARNCPQNVSGSQTPHSEQELPMSKQYAPITANVVATKRPSVAGADRHPGWHTLRKIAARITTPLLPDDYLHLANPLWSARELRGRILEVRRETEDSATLVIKPGWGFSFDYQPGQYMGIGLLVDGRWRWRSYSLTSSPATSISARTVTITVKAMPEGFLSTHLVAGVEPGTIVRLAAPQGNFVLPDPAPPSILFLTAGSGITPVMSMLRTLARRDQITDITHLHSAPTESDVMFGAELAALAANQPGYRLQLRATRTQGRLDLARPHHGGA